MKELWPDATYLCFNPKQSTITYEYFKIIINHEVMLFWLTSVTLFIDMTTDSCSYVNFAPTSGDCRGWNRLLFMKSTFSAGGVRSGLRAEQVKSFFICRWKKGHKTKGFNHFGLGSHRLQSEMMLKHVRYSNYASWFVGQRLLWASHLLVSHVKLAPTNEDRPWRSI